jgi:hypothetical protein
MLQSSEKGTRSRMRDRAFICGSPMSDARSPDPVPRREPNDGKLIDACRMQHVHAAIMVKPRAAQPAVHHHPLRAPRAAAADRDGVGGHPDMGPAARAGGDRGRRQVSNWEGRGGAPPAFCSCFSCRRSVGWCQRLHPKTACDPAPPQTLAFRLHARGSWDTPLGGMDRTPS